LTCLLQAAAAAAAAGLLCGAIIILTVPAPTCCLPAAVIKAAAAAAARCFRLRNITSACHCSQVAAAADAYGTNWKACDVSCSNFKQWLLLHLLPGLAAAAAAAAGLHKVICKATVSDLLATPAKGCCPATAVVKAASNAAIEQVKQLRERAALVAT
jgi:hypothetical protein